MVKKVLLGVGAALLLCAVSFGWMMYSVFHGIKPLVDGTELPGGARTVVDGHVAAFLLPAGDGAVVLVDTGNDANGQALLAALKARSLGPEAVKAIFLTHGHPDHVAGCHVFPAAPVYGFAGDDALAAGLESAKGPLTQWLGKIPPEKRCKVTHHLEDDQVIEVGTLKIRALAVPGHTAGSAAFLANEVLFLGDNATADARGEIRSAPWPFTDDQPRNRQSLVALTRRLSAPPVPVKALAFAHSGELTGIDALTRFKPE